MQARPCLCSSNLSQIPLTWWLMTACYPLLSRSHPPFPLSSFPPSLSSLHLQPAANIYLVVYPGSMQSWMSATHEFFCSESMVSRMYSPPFSTCGSSQTLWSHTELCSKHHTRVQNMANPMLTQQLCYFPTTSFFTTLASSFQTLFVDFHDHVPIKQIQGHLCRCFVCLCSVPTLRTNVLSLSGISSGMVVLTSTMADRGMLTLGFED